MRHHRDAPPLCKHAREQADERGLDEEDIERVRRWGVRHRQYNGRDRVQMTPFAVERAGHYGYNLLYLLGATIIEAGDEAVVTVYWHPLRREATGTLRWQG